MQRWLWSVWKQCSHNYFNTVFFLALIFINPIQQAPPARIYAVLRDVPQDTYSLVWSPDGRWLATWNQTGVWLYDTQDFSAEPRILRNNDGITVNTLAFHPNGDWWIRAGQDQLSTEPDAFSVSIESFTHEQESIALVDTARPSLQYATFGSDGNWLYWLHDGTQVARQHIASYFVDDAEAYISAQATTDDLPYLINLMPVSSSPETAMAVVSNSSINTDRSALFCVMELVYVPENTPPTPRLCIIPQDEGILMNPLVSSPDTLMFAASGAERSVMIFADTRITIETNNWVSALAFSPDGEWLAFGENPGLLGFWNTQNRTQLIKQDVFRGSIRAIAFNPANESQLATLHNGVIQIWTLNFTNP